MVSYPAAACVFRNDRTIIIDDGIRLQRKDRLERLRRQRIVRLRLRPARDRVLDLYDRRIRARAEQLVDVRERDRVRGSAPILVEAVALCAECGFSLLLEVLPYGLQVDEGSDAERGE